MKTNFKFWALALAGSVVLACGGAAKPANSAQAEHSGDEQKGENAEGEAREELGRAVSASKVTLAQGLKAAEAQGQPIAAKFELEDGKLQLSVYTQKDGAFSEIVVDHDTGAVAETKAITEGEDFAAAQGQTQLMAASKSSLTAAVEKATSENGGYQAVSVFPEMADGHQSAKVTLAKGEEFKSVSEALR